MQHDHLQKKIVLISSQWSSVNDCARAKARLGMSVTTQGGSGRQYVTGSGRNISKYRFVLLNVHRFWEI